MTDIYLYDLSLGRVYFGGIQYSSMNVEEKLRSFVAKNEKCISLWIKYGKVFFGSHYSSVIAEKGNL